MPIRKPSLIFAAVLLATSAFAEGANGPQIGEAAPDFDLPRLGGGRLDLYKLAAGKKATLVMFWSEDCKACRAQFPQLQKLHLELGEKGFGAVAVNRGDPEPLIDRFVKQTGATFPVVLGGGDGSYAVGTAYGVRAYPTNLILDAQGKVLFRIVGYSDSAVRKMLKRAGVE